MKTLDQIKSEKQQLQKQMQDLLDQQKRIKQKIEETRDKIHNLELEEIRVENKL